jgi:hypothetical protein
MKLSHLVQEYKSQDHQLLNLLGAINHHVG